jgi:hypothetical protein
MKFSLLLSSLLNLLNLARSESIIIITLPQSGHTEVSASWERGEEILPGALAAIDEARNSSPSLNLTLFVATSAISVTRQDFPYSGNVLEIIANLTRQKRLSDIIGIAGVLHPNILAIFSRIQLRTASLIHFDQAPRSSSVHYSTASVSILTDSIIAFLNVIHPKKIEIITETEESYNYLISRQLCTKVNTCTTSNIQINTVNKHQAFSSIIDSIINSNIHVIVLSAGPSTVISFLCEAYKRGLIWPKYAWILHSYRLDDLLRSSMFNKRCMHSVQKILEGVFIFQLTYEGIDFNSEMVHCPWYDNVMSNGRFNPYAFLLHGSVWNLISSVGTRSNFHSSEVTSSIHDSSKIYAYHNMNSTANLIGIYDGISNTLTNVSEIMFIDYDLPIVNKAAILVPYLLPLPILCFIFNTILLVLYIVFHNEPSIKSTSVSISMLILIGCYILIGFSTFFVIEHLIGDQFDVCMILIWLSGIGLSIPLIFATILVKMLRVYRIFTAFKILKQSAHLSDFALLVYTILVLSPNVILLILWTAIDPLYRVDKFIEHPGYIENVVTCRRSNYELTWFVLAFVYIFLLSAAVVIVAIKSRNIRLALFKDTKKVNILIFLLYIVGISMFSYWKVLLHSGYMYSYIVLYAGHMFMAFLCQIILFVPKIWPAIQTKIIHHNCKHRGQ